MEGNEFDIYVNKVRRGDRIFYNDEWRTVTGSRQYLGQVFENASNPKWIVSVAKTDSEWDWTTYPTYGKQLNDNYDPGGPEYIWPYDCTIEIPFYDWHDVVRIFSDDVELLDFWLRPIRWWVGVFEVDRVYGGPEEGGWWFDAGEVKQTVPCDSYERAEVVRELLQEKWISDGDSSSVIYRGGDYRISICKNVPSDFPSNRPVYC